MKLLKILLATARQEAATKEGGEAEYIDGSVCDEAYTNDAFVNFPGESGTIHFQSQDVARKLVDLWNGAVKSTETAQSIAGSFAHVLTDERWRPTIERMIQEALSAARAEERKKFEEELAKVRRDRDEWTAIAVRKSREMVVSESKALEEIESLRRAATSANQAASKYLDILTAHEKKVEKMVEALKEIANEDERGEYWRACRAQEALSTLEGEKRQGQGS